MHRAFRLDTARNQLIAAMIHIALLVIPLALAWEHDGPPAYRAGWIIVTYFIEIAIAGTVDLIWQSVRASSLKKQPEAERTNARRSP